MVKKELRKIDITNIENECKYLLEKGSDWEKVELIKGVNLVKTSENKKHPSIIAIEIYSEVLKKRKWIYITSVEEFNVFASIFTRPEVNATINFLSLFNPKAKENVSENPSEEDEKNE